MGETIASVSTGITAAWQLFINDGQRGNHMVSPEIMESWHRCYVAGVDPHDGTCYHLLRPVELNELLEKRKEFIDIARPFMLKLYEFVKGSGFIVMLTDERGYILEAFGDEDTLAWAEKINFKKGAKWTEEEVGTNAIGTGVLLQKPIQTSGAEHYCYKHHGWTCSASPIFDKKGRMVGVLDMSGPVNGTHLHTLGMVVAAVEAIMDQMRIQEKNRQLTMANNRMTNVFLTMSDGVIVINEQGVIMNINPVAKQIIGKSDRELVGHSIQEILGRRVPAVEKSIKRKVGYNDVEVIVDTVNGRVHCLSSGMPIVDDEGNITDVVILVRPIEKVQKLVNRFSGAQATFHFKDIIGSSPQMAEAVRMASLAASGSSNVILEGESGTGKEVFAQAIHNRSVRRSGPFVAVNCGAIPRELIGSELFGYVEGAFTGAKRGGRPGKIELAAGGTLFLDEIGDMPLEQQVALLRVLQDKKITRIGDDKIIPVDFRVICATNKNLLEEAAKGNFREDLYYRLNVVPILIPPLRDHPEDIHTLFDYFIEIIGPECGNLDIKVDPEVFEYLKRYHWPGNVRELQNVVERLLSIAEDGCIHLDHLPSSIYRTTLIELPKEASSIAQSVRVYSEREKRKQLLAENECQVILNLLAKHGGNISEVAKEMEVSRNTVYRKMRLYEIDY
ncbi:MAG TPA: sigma-54-dependent Fis family transcriptional regulator [Syntrophomonadaceae bacterium]|nr:sigma-54-dependent Fis family transcriptional regulator [Syntrophomonadaceae bacterium]